MDNAQFRIVEATPGFDKQAYDAAPNRAEKRRQYRRSEAGQVSERKRKHTRSKWTTDSKYLSKKFVMVDGEGVNRPDGTHDYVLLAISDCAPIMDENGLDSERILTYLWENLSPVNINIIYGGSYDFNFWIKSLSEDAVRELYKANYTSTPVHYRGYDLKWLRGKGFEIERDGKKVKINDIVSFFQRPFIQACDEYLGDYKDRDILVREKARRGNFTTDELANITSYNNLELELGVNLATELRARLNKVDLRPRRWDGPGAIAGALFLREGIKKHRNENIPDAVARAARYAYAGGRFELIRYGNVKQKAYEYDINSAYPAALRNVPSLVGGKWIRHTGKAADQTYPFALYKIEYEGTRQDIPGPLFCRAANGTVSYPLRVSGFYWTPEYESLRAYIERVPNTRYRVTETWEYLESTDYRPFHFIDPLYRKRQALKMAGDGAHVGIKLALNSCYGKLAQQVGWIPATAKFPARVPTYHQLEWAGYVTSWCRAHVLTAVLSNLESVIAFETDAVFTSEPLDIPCTSNLGEWDYTEFSSLTYVQSGHYYGTKSDGKEVVKCRGIDRGFISRQAVEKALTKPETTRYLDAQLTRFYGAGISLVRGLDKYWCKWITEPKRLALMPTGKRLHGGCDCHSLNALETNIWHKTYCPVPGGQSHEYPVEWINPNPEMSELTELREAETDYEQD